ncbi:MAG: hypothetical protein VKJ02_05950 [Snowella sp.]|nr:hypothetical protein [Snowella sp.]
MPSPNKSQLNLSVDSDLKDRFKVLCDSCSISLAKAFESFMVQCLEAEEIISIPSPNASPSIDIDSKIETAIQEAISPIQEKLLRLVEIVETLQQSLENATFEVDEVIEDELVGQGVTSASLSVIFDEPDAISELENIEPIQEAIAEDAKILLNDTMISSSIEPVENALNRPIDLFPDDLVKKEVKAGDLSVLLAVETEVPDLISESIAFLETDEGINTKEFYEVFKSKGFTLSERRIQEIAKAGNVPPEWGYRAAKIKNQWRWFPL